MDCQHRIRLLAGDGRVITVVICLTLIAVGQRLENSGKRPLIGEDCSVDILFVLDASGSVRGDFTNMRDFVADVAKTLTVSATGHRVSLLEYSGPSISWPQYPFGFSSNTEDFVKFIRKLPFLQGTTATGKALKTALKMLDDRRKEVLTLVIVVTDGYSFEDVEAPAADIRALENVILFAAGVTEFIDRDALVKIAGDDGHLWTNPEVVTRAERSLHEYLTCIIRPTDISTKAPTTSTSGHSSSTTTTETKMTTKLATTTSTTRKTTTTTPVTGCELDLVFVIDFSSSTTAVHGSYVDAAVKIVEQLHVGDYYTRVAMVQYSSFARTQTTFHLNQYQRKENVIKAMREADFTGGTTNTSAGLEQAKEELSPTFGARPKTAQQVAVVCTDGFSQVDPAPSAKRLRESGVTIYAVSAAESEEGADLNELITVAGDPSRVYMPNSFPNLIKTLSGVSSRCRR